MNQTLTEQALLDRVNQLEGRVRKLSEEKANLYLILHMVELLNTITGLEGLLESLMDTLGGSLGGSNVEIYYLDEGEIHYANLFGERRIVIQIDDTLVAEVFKQHQFIEQSSDTQHTLLKGTTVPIACTWGIPLLIGKELIGAIKMTDLLGSAQMRNFLMPFFSHMALILNNQIKTRIAESANRAKTNFLATMSHEIRTPLNGILGMAQILSMPDCDPSKHQECASTILASGQTLLRLLNDVLDLSKIEANRFELVYSAKMPEQLISEVQALFLESAHQKNLEINSIWRGPPEKCYEMDQSRVIQMLSNLVSNAIKFTSSGVILIEANELNTADSQTELEFSVTDNGIGIAAENQRLLFKPFTQIDNNKTRRYAGTGLGLSIVQHFAELMQGKVGLESSLDKGARFWFRIPCKVIECITTADTLEPKPRIFGAVQPDTSLINKLSLNPMSADEIAIFRDNTEVTAALEQLDNLLAQNMFQSISQFKVLQNLLTDSSVTKYIDGLGQLVNEMKFDQARKELQALRDALTDRSP